MRERRLLGKTGLQIPPVVFGATSLGNLFRAISVTAKADIVRQWMASGLSPVVIDSAGKYGAGLSLEVIGRELEALHVSPESVIISNKLAWRRVPLTSPEPTFEPGVWFDIEHDAVQDISYAGIMRCWQEGNDLLGNYPAQLVSVHDPDEYLAAATDEEDRNRRLGDILEAYRALTELRQAGQVAGVGVGAKNWRTIQELDGHCDFDWVMLANSFTIMHHPPELVQFIERLASRNVGVINSALFHGGFLLGGEFLDYRQLDPQNEDDRRCLTWRTKFHNACRELGVSAFDVGVAFGKSHPGISAVALSSSRADRIPTHVDAAAATLDRQVWEELRRQGLIDDGYEAV